MQNCPECNAEVPTGSRWCGLCHANVLNKEIGRLASPGKRLGAYFLDLLVPIVALILILFVASAGAATETEAGAGLGVLFAAPSAYRVHHLGVRSLCARNNSRQKSPRHASR